jgi:hypothetical protein
MTVYCANCAQVYLPKPIVDLTGNVLIWGGCGCALGPREAEIMHVLLEAPNGGFVEKKVICERVFGIDDIANERKQIDQHLFRLKPKLERLGITIEVRRGDAIALHYDTLSPPKIQELMENVDGESIRPEQIVQRNHCRVRQRQAAGQAQRGAG